MGDATPFNQLLPDQIAAALRTSEATIAELRHELAGADENCAEGLEAANARVKELEAENAKMLEALRPFADHDLPTICRDDHGLAIGEWGSDITVGDFRRARAAYGETVDDDRPVKPASGSVTTISEPIRICAARDAICPNGSDCKEPCAKLR